MTMLRRSCLLPILCLQALQHVMEGCGEAFRPHLDDPLRRLVYRALAHPNRFIRCA